MPARPKLPDGYDLPTDVNGWTHDPESGRNAHVWTCDEEDVSLGVFNTLGTAKVKVFDDRVNGFQSGVTLREVEIDEQYTEAERETVADVLEYGLEWMERTEPSEWSHPDVEEAVFDAPAGYRLDRYFLEARDTTIYYRREGADRDVRMAGIGHPTEEGDPITPETYPYLVIHTWNGSGKSRVALAPWLRAHDDEMHEVVEPPEECGLEIALRCARDWVQDALDVDGNEEPSVGQSGLSTFAGVSE